MSGINMADVVIILILLVVVGFALRKVILNKKQGKGCGCGCEGCSGCSKSSSEDK